MTTTSGAGGRPRPARRWSPAQLDRLGLPAPLRDRLARLVLPAAAGPYFQVADVPVTLGRYALEARLPEPNADLAGLRRLGSDRGSEICVDHSGTVRSVFCEFAGPGRLVNSTVEAWQTGLTELDRLCGQLAPDPIGSRAVALVTAFQARLAGLDPMAMSDPDHWWPLVTEDLRLTASVDAGGVIEFRTGTGALQTVTGYTLPGGGHVERRLWDSLRSQGVAPEQVTRIHTDLEPCMLPGGYCAAWLAVTFPDAESTYSFTYGPGANDRTEGIRALIAFIEGSDT